MRHKFPAVLMCLLIPSILVFANPKKQRIILKENFEQFSIGDWEFDEGWQTIKDKGNTVFAGKNHHTAQLARYLSTEYRVRFRIKLLKGEIHVNYKANRKGRYFINFSETGSTLSKHYYPNTFLHDLMSKRTPHEPNRWHTVEISSQGNTLTFKVNKKIEWSYTDSDGLVGGTIGFETLEDSKALIDDIVVFGDSPRERASWIRTGGPLGGLGYDIRVRPDNPNIMYVTDAWAGVFKSTDGGKNWFPSNSGILARSGESGDAIPIFCLTIDPNDNDTIWIGTQDIRGIYRSIDGGKTWKKRDDGIKERNGITFRGFTVHPKNPDIVYAAAEISSWVWKGTEQLGREFDMTRGVVYKTTNAGKNWKAVWRGDNLARYIWIDPQKTETVYVSTGIFDREAANSNPGKGMPGGVGILKSVDGGKSWNTINNGLHNLHIGTLFMNPGDSNTLLAGTGSIQYSNMGGVYLSTDAGKSWEIRLGEHSISAVEYSLSNPQIAYAGSSTAIYRSQDGGHTWRKTTRHREGWGPPGIRAGFPIDFQIDPLNPDKLFCNNYGGGNFLSLDGGKTWAVASRGYTGAQVRAIAADPKNSKRLVAVGRSGIFSTEDAGFTWKGLNHKPANVLEWTAVALAPSNPGHIFAANNWMGVILKSSNSGKSWQQVSKHAGERMGWKKIVYAPSNIKIMYAGTSAYYSAGMFDKSLPASGLFKSVNGGETWKPANNGTSRNANVSDILVDPNSPDTVWAATTNKGLLITKNGGRNWKTANKGFPKNPSVLSIIQVVGKPSQLFAGLEHNGLYTSINGGKSWKPASVGLNPEASVPDIEVDPGNNNIMYLSDLFSGVYRSENRGMSWHQINKGLRTKAVNDLAISSDGVTLYAATEGEGVYRLDFKAGK